MSTAEDGDPNPFRIKATTQPLGHRCLPGTADNEVADAENREG
jgi:hypothetical protein